MDPPLGDVMLGYPGVFRLIEFKRRSADKTKERVKHTKLASALTSREDLRHISREVHWYVETKKGVPEFRVTAKRYLDMFDSSVPTDGLTEFIASLVEQALCPKPACDLKLLPQYLDAVAVLAGKPDATSSGMLISVGTDGGMQYVVVENIRDVHLPHKLFLERGVDRGQPIQREREMVLARSRGLGR